MEAVARVWRDGERDWCSCEGPERPEKHRRASDRPTPCLISGQTPSWLNTVRVELGQTSHSRPWSPQRWKPTPQPRHRLRPVASAFASARIDCEGLTHCGGALCVRDQISLVKLVAQLPSSLLRGKKRNQLEIRKACNYVAVFHCLFLCFGTKTEQKDANVEPDGF